MKRNAKHRVLRSLTDKFNFLYARFCFSLEGLILSAYPEAFAGTVAYMGKLSASVA